MTAAVAPSSTCTFVLADEMAAHTYRFTCSRTPEAIISALLERDVLTAYGLTPGQARRLAEALCGGLDAAWTDSGLLELSLVTE